MKTKILSFLAAFAVTLAAQAQPIGYWSVGNATGESANIAVASTNEYYFNCEEFEHVGLRIGFKGNGAGNSTVQVFGYRQLGGSLYETTPFLSQLLTLDGTTTTNTIFNVAVQGAVVVKLVLGNTNSSVAVTNLNLAIRRKAPKEAVFPTSR